MTSEIAQKILAHIQQYFAGHKITSHQWPDGNFSELYPDFRVLEIGNGPKNIFWTYVSSGTWELAREGRGIIEFMIITDKPDIGQVQILTMNALYHRDHNLEVGDSYEIGFPWTEGSNCTHMLVSLPYPYGQVFEICDLGDRHLHIYWLLPITESEHRFKVENGADALETEFEKKGLEYWRTDRESVI